MTRHRLMFFATIYITFQLGVFVGAFMAGVIQ